MGDKLGLYRALAGAGPLTPAELAERTGTAERYVREWLNAQAAGGYVEYDPDSGRYTLPPEQAVALTDERAPPTCRASSRSRSARCSTRRGSREAARSGEGVGWHEHDHDVFDGCERFFRPGYNANLLSAWLPALDGVVEKLERGATVADVGCGHGSSTILMATGVPAVDLHRLRLPRRLDRDGAGAGARGGPRRPRALRRRAGGGVQRRELRPRDDVRLPARHGRSRRRRAARARVARRRTAPG